MCRGQVVAMKSGQPKAKEAACQVARYVAQERERSFSPNGNRCLSIRKLGHCCRCKRGAVEDLGHVFSELL
jgi:hypothetical protein